MNGRVAFPLVLGAVILTAGSELERMAVRSSAKVKLEPLAVKGDETVVWKTTSQPASQPAPGPELEPPPPSFALSFSSLLARAQEQESERAPKVTATVGKCKLLRRSRLRACKRRAGSG
jgi:hypothetical protein